MNLRRSLLVVTFAAHAAYPAAFVVALMFNAVGGTNASASGIVVLPFVIAYVLVVVLPLTVKGWRGSRWACGVLAMLSALGSWLYLQRSHTPDFQSEREADERFAAGLTVAFAVAAVAAAVAAVLRSPDLRQSNPRAREAQ